MSGGRSAIGVRGFGSIDAGKFIVDLSKCRFFEMKNFDAGIFPTSLSIMDRSCRECNLLPCDEKVSHPDPRSSSITIIHH